MSADFLFSKHYADPDGGYIFRRQDGTHLRWFYDRYIRLWTVTEHDSEGNQIGDAEYDNNKRQAIETILRWVN